jgi:O-antigen ligase
MTLSHRTRSNERRVLSGVTLLYVASIPLDILPVANGRTLTGPLALLLIATWFFSGLRRPQKINFPRSAGTLLFLYCAWIICTIFWSVDTGESVAAAQRILLQAPLVVVLSNTLGRVWLRSLVTLGCSTSVLGLILLASPADAARLDRTNIGGIDENVTAMVLVVGFAALVYLVTSLGGRSAFLLLPPAVVTGAATLHGGSKSGAIATVAVLVVALLPLIRRGGLHPVLWFRAAGIVLLMYSTFTFALDLGLMPQRVLNLMNQGASYQDANRSQIIDLFLQTFDHWALVGVGVGNDATYLAATEGVALNAHSLLWATWIETGLVGLLLLAAFLVVVIKRGLRSVAPEALILLAVPIVIFAITLGGERTSVFWFVIALALTQRPSMSQPVEMALQAHVELVPEASAQPKSVTT